MQNERTRNDEKKQKKIICASELEFVPFSSDPIELKDRLNLLYQRKSGSL